MRKIFLTASGALVLATVAFTGNAQAQCFWTGLGYSCGVASAAPYPAWNAWDYRDYRFKPGWLPSYPGPRPGG